LVAVVAGAAPLLGQVTTLSQSTNPNSVVAGVAVACSSGSAAQPASFTTFDNSYLRSYSLLGVGGSIDIVSVRFGVEACILPAGGTFPLQVRLYNDANGGAPTPYAGLTLRKTEHVNLSAMVGSIVTVPITGPRVTFTTSNTLVVEIFSPANVIGSRFYIGCNSAGQSQPGYLRAVGCNFPEPTNTLTIASNPAMHMIIDVNYVPTGTGVPYPGTQDDLAMWTGLNGGALTSGYNNYVKNASAGNTVQIKVGSPNNGFTNRELILIAQGFPNGNPPSPPAAPNVWVTLAGMTMIIGGDASLLGPALLAPGGTTVSFLVPPGLNGNSVIFQGAILTWTPPLALNGTYATTNGHVFQM
jgi:hypothetical protein